MHCTLGCRSRALCFFCCWVLAQRFPLILEFTRDPWLKEAAAFHFGIRPSQLQFDPRVDSNLVAAHTSPGQASDGGWHKDGGARG